MPVVGLSVGGSGLWARPKVTPGDGDPVGAALHLAIMRRDAAAVRETLAAYTGNELSTLISVAARSKTGAYSWLRSERRTMDDDPLMLTLLGSATINYAWSIRTSYGARHVSREQFASFHGALREAEEHLYRAVELDPKSAAPWAHLVTSGRGLEVGLDVIERRFEAVVQRCPDHRIAHQQMLQSLCKKWFGSHEQMHAFASEAAKGPHAASLAHLVAIAHLERWLALGVGLRRGAYMRESSVRKELREAAEASLFRPDYDDPRSEHFDANLFAMAFSLAGMNGQAKRAFQRANGVVTVFPWQYLNGRDQVTPFTRRRRAARLALFA